MARCTTDTRTRILTAENHLVESEGVERLTLETAAQAAGVSKGGLLYHFPNKDALIEGMVRQMLDEFTLAMEEVLAQEPEAPGRWARAYVRATLIDVAKAESFRSKLLAAAASSPTLLPIVKEHFAMWQRKLEQDGIDPTLATLIRIAADGLWFVALFDLAPPDAARREALGELMGKLTKVPSGGA